jgi:hypothetical protein
MGNVPMTRPEEMLAEHKTDFFHDSTFVEVEGGRILHAADTRFTTSDDGGITWSRPFECKDVDGNPVGGGGTSLVRLSGKGIGLAGMRRDPEARYAEGPWRGPVGAHILFWRSEDGGKTWERPVRATPPGIDAYCYQDVLLRTSSGRIILPIYVSLVKSYAPIPLRFPHSGKLVSGQWVSTSAHFFGPRFPISTVCYSDDDGRTWQWNGGGVAICPDWWTSWYSYTSEPTVAEVAPGRLVMPLRTILGRLFFSWSEDNGESWTWPQATSLATSTAPAQIRTLPTGHLLVVWNQESEEEVKRGYNRTRLSAAISRNGGSIWEFFQNVESMHEETRVEPGPIRPVRPAEYYYSPGLPAPEREGEHILEADFHGRWSYPSVFVMKDRVLIAYTYSYYEEHATKAQMVSSREKGLDQKLKVLPLSWFYGGKEPADNPMLKEAYEPAKP